MVTTYVLIKHISKIVYTENKLETTKRKKVNYLNQSTWKTLIFVKVAETEEVLLNEN